MAFTMGPIVFVVVVFGGLGSLSGCFIASIPDGPDPDLCGGVDVSLRICWPVRLRGDVG